jgi:hypothetical protein
MNQNDQAIEQEIQAKGLTAPRLTPDDIDAAIISATFTTLPSGKVMVCELTLRNGFTVRGEAATVSKENFNEEIGQKISHQNARDKVWELEGYLLQERLATAPKVQPAPGATHPGYSALQPHQQRVVDELAELEDKRTKLKAFFDTPICAGLAEDEQWRLARQHDAMEAYGVILGERIAAFTPATAPRLQDGGEAKAGALAGM